MRELFGYLWPSKGAYRAKLQIVAALLLLLVAKLYVVRVPFIFKVAVDALSAPAASGPGAVGCMLLYGLSRALYTLLQATRRTARPIEASTATVVRSVPTIALLQRPHP